MSTIKSSFPRLRFYGSVAKFVRFHLLIRSLQFLVSFSCVYTRTGYTRDRFSQLLDLITLCLARWQAFTFLKAALPFNFRSPEFLEPVHTGPDEFETGRIFVQIRLAVTQDPRNRTNSSNANLKNS